MPILPLPQKPPTRWFALTLAALAATLAPACGSIPSSTPTPDPVYTTETVTGSLPLGGYATHAFQVTQSGGLTVALTSLSPQTTITVGLGVGRPSGSTCALISSTSSARAGEGVISGTIGPGSYCVSLYDLGNQQVPNDFVVTLIHP